MLDDEDAMRIVKADLANLTMQAKGDRREVSSSVLSTGFFLREEKKEKINLKKGRKCSLFLQLDPDKRPGLQKLETHGEFYRP